MLPLAASGYNPCRNAYTQKSKTQAENREGRKTESTRTTHVSFNRCGFHLIPLVPLRYAFPLGVLAVLSPLGLDAEERFGFCVRCTLCDSTSASRG